MFKPHSDVELAERKKEYPNGFASLAAFIASDPDNTSTIYRRFERLAARNLLYLQSRLQKLEAMLDELDEQVLQTHDEDSKSAATSWEDFECLSKYREDEKQRMEVAEDIQKALEMYRKTNRLGFEICNILMLADNALLLHSKLLRLKAPATNTLKAFRQQFGQDAGKPMLRGHSSRILDDEDDLVALRVPTHQDRLTMAVQQYCPWLFVVSASQGMTMFFAAHFI